MRMDVTPLRTSRDFRLLFTAGWVFYFGSMVAYVAVPFQIYDLTGSNFMVGLVGLVELVPLIVFGLYGGALADHVDRRKLLVGCGLAQVVLMAAFAANAFRAEPQVWPMRAGFVADAWSVRGAITSGNVACVGGVLLTAAALQDFWSYDARTDPYAVAERQRRLQDSAETT